MFNKSKRIAELEEQRDNAQIEANSIRRAYMKSARLISITRNGRLNIFTFIRNGEIFTIETYGTMSDDLDGWRKMAGLT